MDLRNIPYRSDVVTWNADDLAEYFRTVSLTMFHLCMIEEQTTVALFVLTLCIFIMGKAAAKLKAKTQTIKKLS